MSTWQGATILLYAFINLAVFFKGFYESKNKKNAYGLVRVLTPLGIFAWGDAVIFGPFWIAVSVVTFILQDWYLFLLTISVFWVVRSLGETIYWFNQQFSSKAYEWNKPENLPFHSIFHDDSVWYIHQIMWQCTTVVSIITSIYLASLWLGGKF
jgi:hypothetical protein